MGLVNMDAVKTASDYEKFLSQLEGLAAQHPDNKTSQGVAELAGALRTELDSSGDGIVGNTKREKEIIRALNEGLVGLDFSKDGAGAVKQRILDFIHDVGKVSKTDVKTLEKILADAHNEIGVTDIDKYGAKGWDAETVQAKAAGDEQVWNAALDTMRRGGVGNTDAERRLLDALTDKLPGIDWSKPEAKQALGDLLKLIGDAGHRLNKREADAIIGKLDELSRTQSFQGPVASNESMDVVSNVDAAKDGVKLNVLNNDSDANGDKLRVVLLDAGADGKTAKGHVSMTDDGEMIYKPDEGATGQDKISYWVSDGKGGVSKATTTINITAGKDEHAPGAVDDTYTVAANEELQVAAGDSVLKNDVDAERARSMTVTDFKQPEHGKATVFADGSFNYTPDKDFVGTDTLTYKVKDGSGKESTGTISIQVGPKQPDTPKEVPSTGGAGRSEGHDHTEHGSQVPPVEPHNAGGINDGVLKLIEDILALAKEGKLSKSDLSKLLDDAQALLDGDTGGADPEPAPASDDNGDGWQAAVDPATGKPVAHTGDTQGSGKSNPSDTGSGWNYFKMLEPIAANFNSQAASILDAFGKSNNKA